MVPALFAAAVLTAAPATHSWKFPTGPMAELEVSLVSGSLTIKGGATDEVRVVATPTPPWTVEATSDGKHVNVQVCCGPCKDERKRSCEGDVKLVIQTPAASSLEVGAVSAAVTISEVVGAQAVSAVSGAVEIVGSAGKVGVTSVSGSVKVSPARLDEFSINTVSGDVKVKLPVKADAQLNLSTVSGALKGKRMFGSGKSELNVSTVSGSVETEG